MTVGAGEVAVQPSRTAAAWRRARAWQGRHADLAVLLALALARLVLHVLANTQYGYHRDELGLRDDALALDTGYVNYPPLVPWIARAAMELFGDSLTGFRFFSASAQCVVMLLAGLIARELGGGRMAQVVAALAASAAPFVLLAGSQMQYVSFDLLWWVLVAWLFVRLLGGAHERTWLLLGVVIGLGMLTRYTMLFCAAGVVVATLASPLRRQLAGPWPWVGVAVSLLLFVPNALWQWQHEFVYLDFAAHIRARDVRIGRTDGFWPQQAFVNASPLLLPLWLAGLGWLALSRHARRFRPMLWLYVVPAVAFTLLQARAYYLAPAYPMLMAAGAVAVQHGLARLSPRASAWARVGGAVVLAAALVAGAVLALPLAPVDSAGWRASRAVHDNFAEQIGWEQLVAQVAAIHAGLPEAERRRTGILASNYGQAGAINRYGPRHGLPRAISGVNTHWYRGYGEPPPETLIVLGADPEDISRAPATCVRAGRVRNAEGVDNEETRHNPDIFVCRDIAAPWPELWAGLRSFG